MNRLPSSSNHRPSRAANGYLLLHLMVRTIKRGALALAILVVLATSAAFVSPAHHASAASMHLFTPTIALRYTDTGNPMLVGSHFSPGETVYLGKYAWAGQNWLYLSSDSVVACGVYVTIDAPCSPGSFTYALPGNLNVYAAPNGGSPCSGNGTYSIYAYDYTAGWSNSIDLASCIA